MSRVETEILANGHNLQTLCDACGRRVDHVTKRLPRKQVVLDIDISESPTHGQQGGPAYNGHFGRTCYHPLFCSNQDGDVERAMLRKGNVDFANYWRLGMRLSWDDTGASLLSGSSVGMQRLPILRTKSFSKQNTLVMRSVPKATAPSITSLSTSPLGQWDVPRPNRRYVMNPLGIRLIFG